MKKSIPIHTIIQIILGTSLLVVPIRAGQIERKTLQYLASLAPERAIISHSNPFKKSDPSDRKCQHDGKFIVYLIDNFEQSIQLTSEVSTTHGELLQKSLESGREDIVVKPLNTSLTKGLAMVINDLRNGKCADAVISSIPGSNYTYHQISTLLSEKVVIDSKTILTYRKSLVDLMKQIAFHGFPSARFLKKIDVNWFKLKEDARKVTFAEALGRFNVPLIIPYGNRDTTHLKETRSVNILSIVSHVRAYSALDQFGRRLSGYPYSPLSRGDERAVYHVREIPDRKNPTIAHLDVNDDGVADYTFNRVGKIPFRNEKGIISFAPPLLSASQFKRLIIHDDEKQNHGLGRTMVLTSNQYRLVHRIYGCMDKKIKADGGDDPDQKRPGTPKDKDPFEENGYVWLNSPFDSSPFHFKAVPWIRGVLTGTSLIPPNKVKELLTHRTEPISENDHNI